MTDREMMKLWLMTLAGLILFLTLITTSIANASGIESTIRSIARQEGVDPNLAVAIARVESGLNPKKIGRIGEVGLFQLRPEFHKVKRGDVKANIRTAMKYLREVKRFCEPTYKDAWFICYNVGPNYKKRILYPRLFKYYVQVMGEMNRIAKGD